MLQDAVSVSNKLGLAVFDEQHVSATTCSGSPAHGFVPRGAVPVSNQIGLQNRRVCSYGIQNLSGFFVKVYELVITNPNPYVRD